METRKCEVCGQMKPVSEMSKSYTRRCKSCVAEHTRMVRQARKNNKPETLINWEQRRYEIAKDVMQGILFGFQETREEIDNQCQGVAKASIVLADALIKELKGE